MKPLHYLFLLTISVFASCQTKEQEQYPKLQDPLASLFDQSLAPFYYGVASGDPLRDAVIIWTKVTPADSLPTVDGSWELSTKEDFSDIVSRGSFSTGPERNYTVKVDVMDLEAGATYFYRLNTTVAIRFPVGQKQLLPKLTSWYSGS